MGKGRWQALLAAYERFRTNGKLPATYEVVYGHAWKPTVSKRKTIDGQQTIPLDDFKRMVTPP
jgi:malonyl-CoA O-methyltransferase